MPKLKKILNNNWKLSIVKVKLINATGRISANDIYANKNVPEYLQSCVDGYVVSAYSQNKFKVIQKFEAGDIIKKPPSFNYAYKIYTGTYFAYSKPCIIPEEQILKLNKKSIKIHSTNSINFERLYFEKGYILKKGTLIIKQGERIKPSTLYALSALGINSILVYSMPRVFALGIGDEISLPGFKKTQDFLSNVYFMLTYLKQLGAKIFPPEHIDDNPEKIIKKIKKIIKLYSPHLIITSGGTGKSSKDFVNIVYKKLNSKNLNTSIVFLPGPALPSILYFFSDVVPLFKKLYKIKETFPEFSCFTFKNFFAHSEIFNILNSNQFFIKSDETFSVSLYKKLKNIIAICGESNSGKTYVISELIRHLNKKGYKVGYIKHSSHIIEDTEGKDTCLIKKSNPLFTILTTQNHLGFFGENFFYNQPQLLGFFIHKADLILIEGGKELKGIKKIFILNKNSSTLPDCTIACITSATSSFKHNLPVFSKKNIKPLTDFILKNLQ